MQAYSHNEMNAIYELGRLYYEMGFFTPAERIFAGLVAVDKGETPSRIGLGLIKLEGGLATEAAGHFRLALQSSRFTALARLGLCCAFVAGGEFERARSLLAQLKRDGLSDANLGAEHARLWEAMSLRCAEAK